MNTGANVCYVDTSGAAYYRYANYSHGVCFGTASERSPQSPTYQNTNFCCVTGSGSKGIFDASTSFGVCFGCKS